MIKILVFGVTENPGGMESVIMNYYRHIDRSRIQFEFLCNTEEVAYEEEIQRLGGVIHRIPARRDGRKTFHQALRTFFEEHGGDYQGIWMNTCSLANIDYLTEAKKAGIHQRIIHCHNAANGDSFLRGCLHRVNRLRIRSIATDFWTCSADSNAWFFGKGIEKLPSYRVIPNAIDVDAFAVNEAVRREYRKKLHVESSYVIGHIGRFHPQKNQEFLIPVLKEMLCEDPDCRLLFIGQGETRKQVRALVRKAGLEKQVLFLGVRSDIRELLQAMDVFALPSRYEGLGVVLLEAQAAGVPCVAADTVPREVQVNRNFSFCPITKGPDIWSRELLSWKGKERIVDREAFAQKGFDIGQEARKLEDFFLAFQGGLLDKTR